MSRRLLVGIHSPRRASKKSRAAESTPPPSQRSQRSLATTQRDFSNVSAGASEYETEASVLNLLGDQDITRLWFPIVSI